MATTVRYVKLHGAHADMERDAGRNAATLYAEAVFRHAEGIAPVVTGAYRNSLTIQQQDDSTVTVGGTVSHASNVEQHYGTLKQALFGGEL